MADDQKKCAHSTCNCMAATGSSYCCQFCEDSKDLTTLQCDCGHGGCERRGL